MSAPCADPLCPALATIGKYCPIHRDGVTYWTGEPAWVNGKRQSAHCPGCHKTFTRRQKLQRDSAGQPWHVECLAKKEH